MIEKEKEELFEKVWSEYWWKKRGFGYRINNSEECERETLAEMFDTFIKVTKKRV